MIDTIDMRDMNLLDLIGQDIPLVRAAATHGGEYAGPCFICGGKDRFRFWPSHPDGKGKFWCRQCGAHGDAIDYLRQLHNLSYPEACERLHIPPSNTGRPAAPTPQRKPQLLHPPSAAWQEQALGFVEECRAALWTEDGQGSLDWLHQRGLQDETIQLAGLGLNDRERYRGAELWGLPAEHKRIWLPRGVCIPWLIGGALWRVNVRRPEGQPKYCGPAGYSCGLYGADSLLDGKRPAVLVEGEFDALLLQQEAGDLLNVVATGSTGAARRPRWIGLLAQAPSVLVAFDADQAGDHGAEYWLQTLGNARRWRPYWEDPTAMAQGGVSLRNWIEEGLVIDAPAPPPTTTSKADEVEREEFVL
ncbi:MAG: hypothetical protein HOC74_12350 [Gemmatimonadetes bacterium]|jgi:DNA primase|nr:hypothetical protein [Gemmatimonadota bacterium]